MSLSSSNHHPKHKQINWMFELAEFKKNKTKQKPKQPPCIRSDQALRACSYVVYFDRNQAILLTCRLWGNTGGCSSSEHARVNCSGMNGNSPFQLTIETCRLAGVRREVISIACSKKRTCWGFPSEGIVRPVVASVQGSLKPSSPSRSDDWQSLPEDGREVRCEGLGCLFST